jgi:hypothetical protein
LRLLDVVVYIGGQFAGSAKMRWPEDARGDEVALAAGTEIMVFVTPPDRSGALVGKDDLAEVVGSKR